MIKRNVLVLLGIAMLLGAGSSALATPVTFTALPGSGPQAVPDFSLDITVLEAMTNAEMDALNLVDGKLQGTFSVLDAAQGIYTFTGDAYFQPKEGTQAQKDAGKVRIQFSYLVDPDPLVSVALAVTNGNVASSISATAVAAISPDLYYMYAGSYSGSLTDLRKDGISATGILLTVDVPDGSQVGTLPVSGIPQACAFGPNPGSPGPPSYACAPVSGSGSFGPVAASSAKVVLGLTGSANDVFTFNGAIDLIAVPEPGTSLMMGAGLLGLAAISRRLLGKK